MTEKASGPASGMAAEAVATQGVEQREEDEAMSEDEARVRKNLEPLTILVMETGVRLEIDDYTDRIVDSIGESAGRQHDFTCIYAERSHQIWVRPDRVLAVIGYEHE